MRLAGKRLPSPRDFISTRRLGNTPDTNIEAISCVLSRIIVGLAARLVLPKGYLPRAFPPAWLLSHDRHHRVHAQIPSPWQA